MRVLYITAAHDQHIMHLGDSKPAQSASPSSYAGASVGSVACLHPAADAIG